MSVGVLAKRSPSSGNLSTADRIGLHLHCAGYKVVHIDASGDGGGEDGSGAAVVSSSSGQRAHDIVLASIAEVTCVVGLHAYHAGKWLVRSTRPFALVFGGTDVYSGEYVTTCCHAAPYPRQKITCCQQ